METYFETAAKVLGSGLSRRQALARFGGAAVGMLGLSRLARASITQALTVAQCNLYCNRFTAASAFLPCRTACLNSGCSTTAALCGATPQSLICCTNLQNASNSTCVNNTCALACNAGYADCDKNPANGCETGVSNDPNNCGACGAVCGGGGTCTSGSCGGVTCNGGQTNCNNTCVSTGTDPFNCGACGAVCPSGANAAATCTSGSCGLTCNAGFSSCSGTCVNVGTDVNNCGACGRVCPSIIGGSATCTGGSCGGTCSGGQTNCNGSCVNETTDVNNCGTCGNVCNLANATASCTGSVCQIASCNNGFGNCDGNPANGCETNLNTSVSNCGACGQSCSNLPNVLTATCSAGACSIVTCKAGFKDCNNNPSDGCETNINTSVSNCGACGNVCNAGQSCVSGNCTAEP